MELPQLSAAARRERLSQFVEVVHAGSQRQAAISLGFSPGLVSRVLSGHREMRNKLLRAIASIPNINSDWLATGIGNPISGKPKTLTDIGSIVPVARKLLPGPLLEHEDLLSNAFIAVPRSSYGVGVYAVPVSSLTVGMKVEFKSRWLLAYLFRADDTLLINTDVTTAAGKRGQLLGVLLRNGNPSLEYTDNNDGRVGVVTQLFRSF